MVELEILMKEVVNSFGFTGHDDDKITLFQKLSQRFSVIPLRSETKKPEENEWTKYCFEKREFYKSDFNYKNAGIACGPASGVLVLDVDDVNLFNIWAKEHNVHMNSLDTFAVKTGSGGFHYYFEYPRHGNELRTITLKHNGENFGEVRGVGAQVVAPGSTHPETKKIYEIVNYNDIAKAPLWLLEQYEYKTRASTTQEHVELIAPTTQVDLLSLNIDLDTKMQILYPWVVGERSEKAMSVICKLVIAGIPDDQIHAIFEKYQIGEKHREHGANRSNVLQKEILKAREKCKANIDKLTKVPVGRKSLSEILKSDKKLEFLIEGLWPKEENMILFGAGGGGKSLLSLMIASEIACPSQNGLLGKWKVKEPGRVLMIQSENSEAAYNNRMTMNKSLQKMAVTCGDNICVMSDGDDVMVSGDILEEKFFSKIRAQIEDFKPTVVIFDPLVSFHRADENANVAMRNVLDRFIILQTKYHVNILIIHHSGKGESNSRSAGRGASSIFDWCRNSIELKYSGKGSNTLELVHHKANNLPLFGSVKIVRDENLNYILAEDLNVKSMSNSSVVKKVDLIDQAMSEYGGKVDSQSLLIDKMLELSKAKNVKMSNGTAHKLITEAISFGKLKTANSSGNKKVITQS